MYMYVYLFAHVHMYAVYVYDYVYACVYVYVYDCLLLSLCCHSRLLLVLPVSVHTISWALTRHLIFSASEGLASKHYSG